MNEQLVVSDPVDLSWMGYHEFRRHNRDVARALGTGLASCREEQGWTRKHLASLLPSGIGERTVLSYEHGSRVAGDTRWVEMCAVLGVRPGALMDLSLQHERLALDAVVFRIDLHQLRNTSAPVLRPLGQWAANRLNTTPGGIAEVHPLGMRELAAAVGNEPTDLMQRMAHYEPLSTLQTVVADPTDLSWMKTHELGWLNHQFGRVLGHELRLCRAARGWSRGLFVTLLPSGIGERTVLSYEHGSRVIGVTRLVELCMALGISPGALIDLALRKVRPALETVLHIDLHQLMKTIEPVLRPLGQWARNRLNVSPGGIAALHPLGMRELAATVGLDQTELTSRLLKFAPPQSALPDAPERERDESEDAETVDLDTFDAAAEGAPADELATGGEAPES